jgi:LPS export ABC transporter protein LptC
MRNVGVLLLAAALACGPDDLPPTTVAADSADMVYFGVRHHVTDEGVRRATIEADSAYFFDGPQLIEMLSPTVTFYSPEGVETSTLTAREGTYRWRSGNMEARGNVVAVTPDGRRLETSLLEYQRSSNEIVGTAPFVFTTPEQRIEGNGFRADPDFQNVVASQPRGNVGRVEIN